MFDVGFWEISLIMVVALIVIGPERLPGVARKAGMWVGRGRRFVRTIKEDIDREIAADELRKVLKAESDADPVHEIIEQGKDAVHETKESFMVKATPDHGDADSSAKQATSAEDAAGQHSGHDAKQS